MMIKQLASIPCVLGLLVVVSSSCASEDPVSSNNGGSSAAGTPSTGGSSGGTGGATGGSTGGSTGGATGGSGGGVNPTGCTGIRSNMPCAMPGQACPGLVCGIADSGMRDCDCDTATSTWLCTSCNFTGTPYENPPAEMVNCTTEDQDVACTTLGAVCFMPTNGEDICACYTDDEGMNIWDCDDSPWDN